MLQWRTVLLFLCLHLLTESALATRQCFYPEGNIAHGHVPCGDDNSVDTHCCGEGSICMDNRLCLNAIQPYALSRQSCTNKNWSDNCSAQCTKYNRAISVTIFLLTEDAINSQWTYCCSQVVSTGKTGNATCLHSDDESFHIDSGKIMYGYAKLQGVQDPSTNTTTPTPSNKTNGTSSSSSSTGNSHKREVAVGAGVGVPLGVIAAAAIAWGLYERMQKRKAMKNAAAAPGPSAGELQPMMKSDSYTHTPPLPAALPVELGQRDHHIPELQGTPRM